MRTLNQLKTAFLLGSLIGLCMLVGHLPGGPQGSLPGLIFGGIGNFIAYWSSDKIALTAMQARPVSRADIPWLVEMVERLALRAGVPVPRVWRAIASHGIVEARPQRRHGMTARGADIARSDA